jgi:hypothetical protein
MSEVILSDRRQEQIAKNHTELLGWAVAWRKRSEVAEAENTRLRAELNDSTETSRKAIELMSDAVAEVEKLRAELKAQKEIAAILQQGQQPTDVAPKSLCCPDVKTPR